MITVGWHDELDGESLAELTAMVAEAAAYDDEAGFSTAETVQSGGPNLVLRQALARLTPGRHGSAATPLVGYLRLEVDRAGGAHATLLVRPGFRSLGIATLMLETLAGTDGPGWGGTGAFSIGCWARGNHPAAERMAARFGAEPETVTFHLQRGHEVRDVDAADEVAVLAARADGFVHEHNDIRYVLRVRTSTPSG
ncbi:MAG: hypothetical protein ACT4P1_01550 [Sporichthyaceae bacterium]